MRRGARLGWFVVLPWVLACNDLESADDGRSLQDGGASGAGATSGGAPTVGGTGGAAGAAGAGGLPPELNVGWIGGPCSSDAECEYEGGRCLRDSEAFPRGMCTLDCTELCPDEVGMVTTLCTSPERLGAPAGAAADGLCALRCDYGQRPTGCRAGYQCQLVTRHMEPDTEVYACVPGEDAPFVLGACHEELLARGIGFAPAVAPLDSPVGLPDVVCTIDEPIWVSPYLGGITYHPSSVAHEPTSMLTACHHALALNDAARVAAGLGVERIVHAGVYNCRVIAGTTKPSEHGHARAVDFMGFELTSGEYVTVLDDWEVGQPAPATPAGQLLREFVQTLYEQKIYNIILTPEYNAAHADHFHCDLTPGSRFFQ